MAEANISVAQDQFSCPVCLELLKNPVSTPCGHSFCMVCINKCWDQEDDKGTYSCPHCRQTFTPRPVLRKNTILADVVEKLKKTELQASQLIQCSAGPEDVECDVCTGRKNKAVKSCLASFCETHLQPHYQIPAYKKHKLVKASRRLQDQICPQHDKLLEVYCHTDQQCICMLSMLDEHKGHDTISAAAERTEKQVKLEEMQRESQQRIQNGEDEIQKLRKAVESHRRSAQTAVENIEKIFTELINSIKKRCSEVTELIRGQEKAAVSQAEEFMKQLQQEIVELKRRNAELEELSHSEDFFQTFPSYLTPAGPAESPTITLNPLLTYEGVTKSMSELREKLEEFCKDENKKISDGVRKIWIISSPEPQTRREFLQYFCQFTLDPNTVNKNLRLSEENKVVTCSGTDQWYHDHPDRFNYSHPVLCRESVSGRCYWEVEWSGNDGVYIAVSYKSVSRKGRGDECWFGCNDQSWSLFLSPSRFSFLHDNKRTKIPIMPSSSRIGVYVDYRAGTLSFYSVSDTMKLLHRVQATFTQLLYPGFLVCKGSTVNCHPETR
ncbi:tripartite motif-containing protein 16-like [Trichomycterus rosablanca]|uniref:tripartite motif-containing protein 16-like n=1 Tax=Trichomycterus rosablanca TaxID=2290929 RepID=UPI002F35F4AF